MAKVEKTPLSMAQIEQSLLDAGYEPFYKDESGLLYCCDCLDVMKGIPDGVGLSLITDPVWPNAINLFDIDDPFELLRSALSEAERFTKRMIIHLGLDSDPRFLNVVPASLRYFRHYDLRYSRPNYKGRILYDRDVAYHYGDPPKSRPGRHVIGSGILDTRNTGRENAHPCPRHYKHVDWLVGWCTEEDAIIIDPFAGSGTTCVAAKNGGRKYIGIEINRDYVEIARERLRQGEIFNHIVDANKRVDNR